MITTLILALGASVTVQLPKEAHVTGIEFTLGDIAQVSGSDEGVVERIRSLALGYAPAPGYSRLLEAEALGRGVRESFPGFELRFEGSSSCRVFARVQRIDAAAIGALARAELARVFEGSDAEFEMLGQLLDLQVPQGRTPAKLEVRLRDRTQHAGSWSVPVEVVVDGDSVRTIWTSWNVGLWADREVLVRDVARGEPLSPGDLEYRRTRVQGNESPAKLNKSALRGSIARRDLRAGEAVRLADIEREVVMRRGDMVHVEVRRGAITARAAAVAQEDARIGDRVRILMSSSRQELVGIATSRERVEIRMD